MSRPVIVCVDDEPLVLRSLREQLLRTLGGECEVEAATGGKEALALLDELNAEGREIPLLISDQIMPGMQGVELLARAHARYPHTLKILLTGHSDADAVGQAVNQANLYRYLTKPWQEHDLALTVREALRRFRHEHELAERGAALHRSHQRLEESLALLHATLDATADGILVLDNHGRVAGWNQRLVQLWALDLDPHRLADGEQLLARARQQLKDPSSLDVRARALQEGPRFAPAILELRNGTLLECYGQPQRLGNEVVGAVWSFRDVTERARSEAIIQHQALHDSLTGLPNRRRFNECLEAALAQAQGRRVGVMFIDLDRFKLVNDTLGHAVGDALLRALVGRMAGCLRGHDLIARWGGDEFTVLLPEVRAVADATHVAQRIIDAVRPPLQVDGHALHVTCSIGLAVYPEDGLDMETLLRHADSALYRAKELGRNDYQCFTQPPSPDAGRLLTLENDLHQALERRQLLLHYQPQVDALSGKITHVEALLRWSHPELGWISPATFIPIAEETGLIVPIGDWVLRTACSHASEWGAMGFGWLGVAVNLSMRQLQRRGLLETVVRVLDETGVAPERLELEVTESAALDQPEVTASTLAALRKRGIRIALDDFGTGYASLSYLKQLPCDTLKIDRSFTMELEEHSSDAAIIRAVVALGEGLGLRIVAEGVETDDVNRLLQSLGCRFMQGYLFSRPVPFAEVERLLGRERAAERKTA